MASRKRSKKSRRTKTIKKPETHDDKLVTRMFAIIVMAFAVLLALYFVLPFLPLVMTGMLANATSYMAPLLILSFLFFLVTLAYFFRKR